eukprot:Rmarinus@m.16254
MGVVGKMLMQSVKIVMMRLVMVLSMKPLPIILTPTSRGTLEAVLVTILMMVMVLMLMLMVVMIMMMLMMMLLLVVATTLPSESDRRLWGLTFPTSRARLGRGKGVSERALKRTPC